MQQTIKAIIAYDGTRYAGWLEQPQSVTVLGQLRTACMRAFAIPVQLLGSSKTDAGVHALGQVLRIVSQRALPLNTLVRAWNAQLPSDILVRSVSLVPNDFHPYHGVAAKVYRYYISAVRPVPMLARYVWYVRKPFDPILFRQALNQFSGTHDFRSFCTLGSGYRDTIRTIDRIYCTYYRRFGLWCVEVRGKKFLHFMVRRMIAAAMAVAQRINMDVSAITYALQYPHAQQHFGKAPSKGLFLHKVLYDPCA